MCIDPRSLAWKNRVSSSASSEIKAQGEKAHSYSDSELGLESSPESSALF